MKITWIIYNCAILYSSTLIGSGILYSLINIFHTRATATQKVADPIVKYWKALYQTKAVNFGLTLKRKVQESNSLQAVHWK